MIIHAVDYFLNIGDERRNCAFDEEDSNGVAK